MNKESDTILCGNQKIKLLYYLPLALWQCWLGVRKSIWPLKSWVMGYWRGYLSGVWCKWFAYGPADATATPSSLASVKSRSVNLCCWLTKVVLENRPLNTCVFVCVCCSTCNCTCVLWCRWLNWIFCSTGLSLDLLVLLTTLQLLGINDWSYYKLVHNNKQ